MFEAVVVLPIPPAELHPNARPHWRIKAKRAKEYRQEVYVELRRQLGWPWRLPPSTAVTMQLTYYFRMSRKRDADGLLSWFKNGLDAFKVPKGNDAPGYGMIVDDDYVTHMPVIIRTHRANQIEVWVKG